MTFGTSKEKKDLGCWVLFQLEISWCSNEREKKKNDWKRGREKEKRNTLMLSIVIIIYHFEGLIWATSVALVDEHQILATLFRLILFCPSFFFLIVLSTSYVCLRFDFFFSLSLAILLSHFITKKIRSILREQECSPDSLKSRSIDSGCSIRRGKKRGEEKLQAMTSSIKHCRLRNDIKSVLMRTKSERKTLEI